MAIVACLISLTFLSLNIYINKKNKSISPITLFFALWSFILFLSALNLYNIYKPSDESYLLIILMLVFFELGSLFYTFIKKKYIKSKKESTEKSIDNTSKKVSLNLKIFYILSFLIILFNLIDCIMIVMQLIKGTPMWQIRNWILEPYGKQNPIIGRRSFLEESFRSIILTPFQTLIPPITAFIFFNSKDKKLRIKTLVLSLVVLITSSIAGGGGRLGFIYYFGCFLLAFFIIYKNKENKKEILKKYKKVIILILLIGIIFVVAYTAFRTGIDKLFKQVYTYFALPPTLLSLWLPEIKNVNYTYGMTTFFGIHSYFFRTLDTIGLNNLVPQIYNSAYQNILNAEIFINAGYGPANAFVTPIYYFLLDGGYPFVCIASTFFGYIVSCLYSKFEKNINIKSFTTYILIMYGVFLTFMRIQTAIPAYIISFILLFFIMKTSTKVEESSGEMYEFCYDEDKKGTELISVIIPIYNVEKFLEKCINSVLNQTYTNLEIILVEDGSPDNCGKICDEYAKKDKRIKVVHKENGGISDTRNEGVANATGKYITFIDSDDYVDDNYIELLYTTLLSNDADISIVSHRVLYNKKCIDKSDNSKFCTSPKLILEKILYDDGIDLSVWAKLYKTDLFSGIKFPKGKLFEDASTTYKLIDAGKKIAVYSKPVYNYVIRTESITNNDKFTEKMLDLIDATKEMTDFIRNKYPDLENACNRRLMYAYLSTLTQLAKSEENNEKIEKELINYINKNRKSVLKDKRAPKRDKFGIYSLIFGFKFYRFVWRSYSKISKRIKIE